MNQLEDFSTKTILVTTYIAAIWIFASSVNIVMGFFK